MSHPVASACALCLKHVSGGGGGGDSDKDNKKELQRHLILLGRILKTNWKNKSNVVSSSKQQMSAYYFCKACASILDSLSTCYDQMKGLELRLEWNLWKLQKVVSGAARVPSRVARLYSRAGRVDELEAMRGWRSMLLRKCTLKLSNRFPKVKLSRIQESPLAQSITKESKTSNEATTTNEAIDTKDVGGSEEDHHHSDIHTTSRGRITDGVVYKQQEILVSQEDYNNVERDAPPFDDRAGPHQEPQVLLSCSPNPTGATPNVDEEEKEVQQQQVDSGSDFEPMMADDSEDNEEVGNDDDDLTSGRTTDNADDEYLSSGEKHKKRRRTLNAKGGGGGVQSRSRLKLQICNICKRGIQGGPWKYKRHYINHHQLDGVEPSQIQHCEVDQCAAYFLTPLQLKTHQRLEHGGGVVQTPSVGGRYSKFFKFEVDSACKLCHKMFLTPELYTQHAKIFHHHREVEPGTAAGGGEEDDLFFSCKVEACSTHCPSAALLQEHMERVHQAALPPSVVLPPWVLESNEKLSSRTCDVCQMVFKRTWCCKQHFKTTHEVVTGLEEGEVVKRCMEDQCVAYFRTERQLSRHMTRIHRKPTEVTRSRHNKDQGQQSPEDSEDDDDEEETGQVVDNNKLLVKSKEKSSRKRLYCPVCPRWYFAHSCRIHHFKKWHDLTLTMPSSSTSSPPAWNCDQPHCSAYFVTEAQLSIHLEEAHQRTDSTITSTTCVDCGQQFRYKWQLKQHRDRTHDKHLLWTRRMSWKRRKKKPVKSLVCDVCGKPIRGGKFHLAWHQLTHSGPDSYPCQCSTCGKKFIHKGALHRHSWTHTREKPYVCQYCGKAFAENLRRHIRRKHPDEEPPPPPPLPPSRKSTKATTP